MPRTSADVRHLVSVDFPPVLQGKRWGLLTKLHGLHQSFPIFFRLERGLLLALAL